ncbi:YciI family protein [Prauserella muralis]|uniref:Uncharacterized protein n=1 Tax=Prauserella muralis TaxID=588067 RepID=A0A2V4B8C2_9PSEU|nr:YciI family protein [Prauserella muralis]PXY31497.1 hypothetical protein BAY60_03735 [Prauserella muralis]TWE14156.1 hypothetical protein FHX69_6293 [Prauserella muralis]
MAWFVVEIRYVQDKFGAVRARHREFLQKLAEEGTVAVAGPLENDIGGMAVYRAENRDELQKIIDADPYHLEGAIAERTVREFKPVIGAWVPGQ